MFWPPKSHWQSHFQLLRHGELVSDAGVKCWIHLQKLRQRTAYLVSLLFLFTGSRGRTQVLSGQVESSLSKSVKYDVIFVRRNVYGRRPDVALMRLNNAPALRVSWSASNADHLTVRHAAVGRKERCFI